MAASPLNGRKAFNHKQFSEEIRFKTQKIMIAAHQPNI